MIMNIKDLEGDVVVYFNAVWRHFLGEPEGKREISFILADTFAWV
jgi:hypothetical protein